ncbi:MAG: hypothetical protein NTNFB02_26740 [Nitrospira sp.]
MTNLLLLFEHKLCGDCPCIEEYGAVQQEAASVALCPATATRLQQTVGPVTAKDSYIHRLTF